MPEQSQMMKRMEQLIDICVRFQKDDFLYDADRNLKMYEPMREQHTDRKLKKVSVNRVFPLVQLILSQIYARNPKATVHPKRKQFEIVSKAQDGTPMSRLIDGAKAASIISEVLSHYAEEADMKAEARLCTIDALVFGYGALLISYNPTIEKVNVRIESDAFGDEQRSVNSEYREYLKSEGISYKRISPADILFPPIVERFPRDIPSIIVVEHVPLDEVLANEKYDPDMLDELRKRGGDSTYDNTAYTSSTESVISRSGEYSRAQDDSFFGIRRIYHVFNKKESRYLVIARGLQRPLLDQEWPYEMDGYPIEFLTFNDHPGGVMSNDRKTRYPISEISIYRDQVRETEIIRNRLLEMANQCKDIICFAPGAVSKETQSKLMDARHGEGIEVDPQAVETKKIGGLINELLAVEERLYDDFIQQSGTNEYRQGLPGRNKTLGEAQFIERAASLRISPKLDDVNKFIKNIYRKTLQILQRNVTTQQVTRISGEDGFDFLSWTRDDILGEYDIEIIPESSAPDNKSLKDRKALEFFNLAYGKPGVDNLELMKRTATQLGYENVSAIIPGHTDPDAAQLARFENQMLMQGQPVQVFPNQNHGVHLNEHVSAYQQLQGQIASELQAMRQQIDNAKRESLELRAQSSRHELEYNDVMARDFGMQAHNIENNVRVAEDEFKRASQFHAQHLQAFNIHLQQHNEAMSNAGGTLVPMSDISEMDASLNPTVSKNGSNFKTPTNGAI